MNDSDNDGSPREVGDHSESTRETDQTGPVDSGAGPVPVGVPLESRPQDQPPPTEEERSEYIASLDVCSNCGEPMSDRSQLICLRCGYDLKTMTVHEVETGVVVDADVEETPTPLSAPGMGGLMLPGIVTSVSALILVIGYLAGVAGLFTWRGDGGADVSEGALSFGIRMAGIGRFVGLTLIWSVCGLGALLVSAALGGRAFGDLRLGAVRVMAIMTAAALASFVALDSRALEISLEIILIAGIAVGLGMLFFRLGPRDAGTAAGTAVLLFLALYFGSRLVVAVT